MRNKHNILLSPFVGSRTCLSCQGIELCKLAIQFSRGNHRSKIVLTQICTLNWWENIVLKVIPYQTKNVSFRKNFVVLVLTPTYQQTFTKAPRDKLTTKCKGKYVSFESK